MRYPFLLLIFIMPLLGFGQSSGVLKGTVSFLTSKNVYVKFSDTKDIHIGDTLYLKIGQTKSPCLMVNQKSSSSCVCNRIGECKLVKGYEMVHYSSTKKVQKAVQKKRGSKYRQNNTPIAGTSNRKPSRRDRRRQERLRARVSASSSSNGGDGQDWSHRVNYRLSADADHIRNTGFSVETYMNYRRRYLPEKARSVYPASTFRIYTAAVKYEVDSSFSVVAGRKINYRASSLGAIDGVQANKFFGRNYIGALVGFRPDIYDYSFNTNLFQYGLYIGRAHSSRRVYSQTTLGLLEQRNNARVDRRYTYFQYSSSFGRSISLFASFELDLYKRVNGVASNDLRLTNMYLSGRYRFSRKLSLTLAYDSRKRILQYETFKTDIEKLLEDDEARQGARIRFSYRPFRYVFTGLSYSRRFQNSHQNESSNINGFLSWSRIPWVRGRLSVRYNHNISSYLNSDIWSVRHSRTMFRRKVNVDMYFRWVNYAYINSEIQRSSRYYGLNLSFRFPHRLSLSILGEWSERSYGNSYRLNTKLIQRLDSKR